MIRIFTRSPYVVSVNDISQTGSKVELFIYDGGSTPPSLPTYTLSKLIPGTGVTENLYNISPYIREYLTHRFNGQNFNTVNDFTEYDEYMYINVVTYNLISGVYVLDQTFTARCYDGYGYYEDLMNVDRGDVLLGDGTKHYYWYDSTNTPLAIGSQRAGIVTAFLDRDWKVYYQNLLNGSLTQINSYSTAGVYDLYRVFPTWYGAGNLMQIYDDLNVLQWEATFIPKIECRYTPMTIDFVNKFGGWQREFFFKASQEILDVNSTTYNLMMSDIYPMTLSEGQRAVFNNNGIRKYIINTGWVDESYGETMQELLLSERVIWVDSNKRIPVKVNTKSINKQKNINNKTINYSIEIELAFDVINSVI
jgi:hypothetical protein